MQRFYIACYLCYLVWRIVVFPTLHTFIRITVLDGFEYILHTAAVQPVFICQVGAYTTTTVFGMAGCTHLLIQCTARSYAVTDSVPERSARYVYHLQLVDASVRRNAAQMPPNPPQTVPVEIVSKGVTSATTRNAVISALRVSPNPAADALAVEYAIEDRVRLNVVVYDLLGNVVTTLAQNLEVPRGTATQRLEVGAWAQGVYTVVATARSVNDPTIEYSRALATFSVSK